MRRERSGRGRKETHRDRSVTRDERQAWRNYYVLLRNKVAGREREEIYGMR